MKNAIFRNPFVDCTARDMKYGEVSQFWCNSFEVYNLNENEFYSSHTPIIIEGARGTGKTMILKYLSYFVQKKFVSNDSREELFERLRRTGVGIYFRYKSDFCNLFEELNCTKQQRDVIFQSYYQVYLLRELFDVLADIYGADGKICKRHKATFDSILHIRVDTYCELGDGIRSIINEFDNRVNNSQYYNDCGELVRFVSFYSDSFNKVIKSIHDYWDDWKNIVFIVLLDEYENAYNFQTIINTYLKQNDDSSPLTYRVGMRPGGMDVNNATNIAGERLQIDRDFLLRKLIFADRNGYKQFAKKVAEQRLNRISEYRNNGLTDIEKLLG